MKRKRFSLLSLLVIAALVISVLTPSLSANAKSPSDLFVKKVKSSPSTIQIVWNGNANHYEILQGQNKIYTGKAHSYKLTDLAPHMKYELRVLAYNSNDEVVGKSLIHALTTSGLNKPSKSAYTFDSDGKLSLSAGEDGKTKVKHGKKVTLSEAQVAEVNPLNSVRVNAIVNSDSVVLDWNSIKGINKYTISRNGVQIGTINNSNFVDSKVNIGKTYTYQINAIRPLDTLRKDKVDKYVSKHHLKLNKKEKKKAYNDSFNLRKTVATSTKSSSNSNSESIASPNVITPNSYLYPKFLLRYTTFLKKKYVSNPYCTFSCKYTYFGGDNRGYSTYSSRYRTRIDVHANFASAGESLYSNKSVGQSRGYDSNYNLIGTDYASKSGMYVNNVSFSSSDIHFTTHHHASNPLTSAPAIDYTYTADLYSNYNNGYYVSGNHDKAPYHEVYLTSPYSDTLHQASNQGLQYLFPEFSNNYWSASK